MFRPIAPFVEYAINYDYISKVLCINKDKPEMGCNGKCQLIKKLEKQQEEDYKSLGVSMEEYPVGFVNIFKIQTTKQFFIIANKLLSYTKRYTYLFNQKIFHPPAL